LGFWPAKAPRTCSTDDVVLRGVERVLDREGVLVEVGLLASKLSTDLLVDGIDLGSIDSASDSDAIGTLLRGLTGELTTDLLVDGIDLRTSLDGVQVVSVSSGDGLVLGDVLLAVEGSLLSGGVLQRKDGLAGGALEAELVIGSHSGVDELHGVNGLATGGALRVRHLFKDKLRKTNYQSTE